MAQRTGVPATYDAALLLCRLLAKYTPKIKNLYPTNTELHDALDNANTVCEVLATVLLGIKEFGD